MQVVLLKRLLDILIVGALIFTVFVRSWAEGSCCYQVKDISTESVIVAGNG